MRTEHADPAAGPKGRSRRGTTRLALAALPVAALVLVSGCGSEDPEVVDPTTPAEPGDAAPTTTDVQETTEATETTDEPTTDEPTTDEPTTTEPADQPSETDDEPPAEGAGDAMAFAEEYVELVTSGDPDQAYGMLSPESMTYFPDVSVFAEDGVAELSEDLADASGEPQWAIRSAYEETHDSAQVVSIWGEGEDGEPFAHAFAVRKLDGVSWVVDQEIAPATDDDPRLNWLNPGIQEGVEWWEVNPDAPITFALLKSHGPNVAVTASIDDGSEVSQQLTERPTGGAVMYDLSDSQLDDGLHVVAVSWVAEDDPFVHTSATPAANPGS